jgi:hypothetical protein
MVIRYNTGTDFLCLVYYLLWVIYHGFALLEVLLGIFYIYTCKNTILIG